MRAVIALAALGSVAFAACGSSSPVEVVVQPGITAIDQSRALACDADLLTLQTAFENYTLLNVDPPTVESDLVPDWLHSESQRYDVIDGAIVPAAGSGCAIVPAGATGAPSATMPTDDPARVSSCTAQSKTLQVAIEAYHAMNGASTVPTEQGLVDDQLLRALDDAFDIDASGQVVAAPGGRCDGVELSEGPNTTVPTGAVAPPGTLRECEEQLKLLEVAMEAYFAANGSPAVDESDLVAADLVRRELGGYDIVDGAIVPAPGTICPPA